MKQKMIAVEEVVVMLMNLRVSLVHGKVLGFRSQAEKEGADKMLTIVIEDFRALLDEDKSCGK